MQMQYSHQTGSRQAAPAIAHAAARYGWRASLILSCVVMNTWAIAAFIPNNHLGDERAELGLNALPLNELRLGFTMASTQSTPPQPTIIQQSALQQVTHQQSSFQQYSPAPVQAPQSEALKRSKPQSVQTSPQIPNDQIPTPNSITPTPSPTPTDRVASDSSLLVAEKSELERAHEPALTEASSSAETPSDSLADTQGVAMTAPPINPLVSRPSFSEPPLPPRYPMLARKRGQEGTVWLEVWLDETGQQTKLSVSESSGVKSLDLAAMQAVKHWQFHPHRHEHLAIAARVRIPVEFVLN